MVWNLILHGLMEVLGGETSGVVICLKDEEGIKVMSEEVGRTNNKQGGRSRRTR